MTEIVDPIPKYLAEAFDEAVLAYQVWNPHNEGRLILIPDLGTFRIEQVCDFVSQFTERLPDLVFKELRSHMHTMPDGELIAELEKSPTYAVAGTCLRRMIERRRAQSRG